MAKAENKKKSVAKSQDNIKREPIIKEQILFFCRKHWNEELKDYAVNLYERLCQSKELDISRGRKEIWAAAIIYVIGRLNFLFDEDSEFHISASMICEFFGTVNSTIANKAATIERALNLSLFSQNEAGRIFPESFYQDDEEDALDESEVYLVLKEMMKKYGNDEEILLDEDEFFEMVMSLIRKYAETEEGDNERIHLFEVIASLIFEYCEDDEEFLDMAFDFATAEEMELITEFMNLLRFVMEEEMRDGELSLEEEEEMILAEEELLRQEEARLQRKKEELKRKKKDLKRKKKQL